MKLYWTMILGLGLLVFACSNEEEELLIFHENLIANDKLATELLFENTKSTTYRLKDLLQDDSKLKYRSILSTVDSVHRVVEEVQSELITLGEELKTETEVVDYLEKIASFPRKLVELNEGLLTYYEKFLQDQQDTFSLTIEEVTTKTQSLSPHLVMVDSLWLKSPLFLSKQQVRLLLTQTVLDLERVKNLITEDLSSLSGGKILCGWTVLLPIIAPLKEEIKKGEAFEALIFGFEDLTQSYNSLLKLSVDGKELSVVNGKYAYYKSASIERSKTTILINATGVNGLTGESFSFIKDFSYEIIAQWGLAKTFYLSAWRSYLKYAVGEIILVVLGILIALSINNK